MPQAHCRTLLLAGLLLSGCAAIGARQPDPALNAGDQAARFQARSLHSAALRDAFARLPSQPRNFPPASWTLNFLSQAALFYRPEVAEARDRVDLAQGAKITAGTGPAAGISLSPTYAVDSPPGTSPWIAGIGLDLPVETAGKRDLRLSAADRRIAAAKLALQTAVWQVEAGVRDALAAYLIQQRRAALLEGEVALRADLLHLLHQRLAVGAISSPEVTSAALQLDQVRQQAAAQAGQVDAARLALAAAVGVPGKALIGVTVSWPDFRSLPRAREDSELQRAALSDRTDVQGALERALEADAELRAAEAGSVPDVHLGPGYEWDQGENKISLTLSATLPQPAGPIAEARARRDLAAATFEQDQDTAIGQVEQAAGGYRLALAQLDQANQTLAAASQQRLDVERRSAVGQADRVELDGARLELAVAQLAQVDAIGAGRMALGRLEDAIQTPLSQMEGSR